jgi:hypothetical protein
LEARLLFPSKTPLLLFGIIGLGGALLEIKEGFVAFFVEKFQNTTKNQLCHIENRVGYKRDSALNQVIVELGREINPRKPSGLRPLG